MKSEQKYANLLGEAVENAISAIGYNNIQSLIEKTFHRDVGFPIESNFRQTLNMILKRSITYIFNKKNNNKIKFHIPNILHFIGVDQDDSCIRKLTEETDLNFPIYGNVEEERLPLERKIDILYEKNKVHYSFIEKVVKNRVYCFDEIEKNAQNNLISIGKYIEGKIRSKEVGMGRLEKGEHHDNILKILKNWSYLRHISQGKTKVSGKKEKQDLLIDRLKSLFSYLEINEDREVLELYRPIKSYIFKEHEHFKNNMEMKKIASKFKKDSTVNILVNRMLQSYVLKKN